MKRSSKLFLVLMFSIVVVAVAVVYVSNLHAASPETKEVLSFLEDVVGIDTSKYDVQLMGTTEKQPDHLNGATQLTGKIALESETGKIDVLFKFRNNRLSWCLIRPIEGTPHYTSVQSTFREHVDGFLEKYQEYSKNSEIQEMRNLLNNVDMTENTTKTEGTLKLTVSVTQFSSSFDFRSTVDSADDSGFNVSFRNGQVYAFSDDMSYR